MPPPRKPQSENRPVYSTASGDLRKSERSGATGPVAPVAKVVTVRLDTKSRRGKAVTLVSGLGLAPTALAELGRTLKAFCGSGGTVEEGEILVQGDHREKIVARLTELGYKPKLAK